MLTIGTQEGDLEDTSSILTGIGFKQSSPPTEYTNLSFITPKPGNRIQLFISGASSRRMVNGSYHSA